jgi:hypothetical protein
LGDWGTGAFYDDGSVFSINRNGGLISDSSGSYTITRWSGAGTLEVAQLSTTSPRAAWVLTTEGRLFKALGHVTGAEQNTVDLPSEISLIQNYPNPFNPTTTIRYSLPYPGWVALRVYDTVGRLVITLQDGKQSAGVYDVQWNAQGFPSGVYFYGLASERVLLVRKAVHIK